MWCSRTSTNQVAGQPNNTWNRCRVAYQIGPWQGTGVVETSGFSSVTLRDYNGVLGES